MNSLIADDFMKIIQELKAVRLSSHAVLFFLYCAEKTFRVIQNDVPRIGQQQE